MKKTVLIADDEPHVLRILAMALERAGFTVETVPNGEQALKRVRAQEPDVLITDIEMPRLTGQELCQTIERELPQRRFPIYIMTSSTGLEHRSWSSAISNAQFLEKPVSVRQIVAMLQKRFSCRDQENQPA